MQCLGKTVETGESLVYGGRLTLKQQKWCRQGDCSRPYAAFTSRHMSPGNMYPGRATCILIHICRRTHVARYKMLVRDTCGLYLGDIISIHLCHGGATDGRQTGDYFVADIRNMLKATSGYKWIQLVSGNMCPGVNAALESATANDLTWCKVAAV